jgi:hypothetical protein
MNAFFLRLLILGWLMVPGFLLAQIGPYLRLDYTQASHQYNDFNDFFRSYNAYYGANMAQPFDTLAPTVFSHPNFGLGLRFTGGGIIAPTGGFFITYGRMTHAARAEYANGIQTAADFMVRDLNVVTELGLSIGRVLSLSAVMAGYFRRSVVDMAYIYQDGTYSLGNEYDLLSVHSASVTSLDFGAAAALRLGRFNFPVSITFPNQLISDEGLLTFLDYDERQIRWSDIPRDYATWADDPASIDLDEGFVRAESLRSLRITFGVEVFLFPQKNRKKD